MHKFMILLLIVVVSALPAFADDEPNSILFEELVSVSEFGFAVTWYTTQPSATELWVGITPWDMELEYSDNEATAAHHVEIDGLDPDSLFYFQVAGGGVEGKVTAVNTLPTPPGEFLFAFGQITDTHIGEETAGLITIGPLTLTPGFTWDDPENPYWQFTNEAAVDELNERGVDFVIHKGDVTADADKWQYEAALEIFGNLDCPIHYARGNHDRIQHGEDYFMKVLGIDETDYYFDQDRMRFIIMDSNDEDGMPRLTLDQKGWLHWAVEDSARDNNRVMIFAHHSFNDDSMGIWSVPPNDAEIVQGTLSNYSKAFSGMFAGHSHRAHTGCAERTGHTPYVETPSTKEYPMGYVVTRVYQGGFSQTFYRTSCEECLEWNYMTAGEFFGLAPFFLFNKLWDRNFTYTYPEWEDDDASDDGDEVADDDDQTDEDDDTVKAGSQNDGDGGESENEYELCG